MSLDVVVGPMFSGKSTYALSWVYRQRAIGKNVVVIKPDIDTRYSTKNVIITHNHESIPCVLWKSDEVLNPFIQSVRDADCIVLEEAQFFRGIYDFVKYVTKIHNKQILVVGLDGDDEQRKFGEILDCIPLATNLTKLNSLCSQCRDCTLAPFTRRIDKAAKDSQIDVGGSEKYEAVCLKHLFVKQ